MSGSEFNAHTAETAGLVYTTDSDPGISRRRAGRGFSYRWPDSTPVRDPSEIKRLQKLAVPPAYHKVWFCLDPRGHLQATGYDDRNRKQYRYHSDWLLARDQDKFEHILAFGRALPAIRERLSSDLALPGLSRDKIMATAISLLERTLIRIGNEVYARANGSYGLTTLKNRHAHIEGSQIRFRFRGKSGIQHDVSIRDRRLARVLRQLQELPGQTLFSYPDEEGVLKTVTSADVNRYLKEITGESYTAKDFRTWAASLAAYAEFIVCDPCGSLRARKRTITGVTRKVARLLGNTPAVCRKSYIHHELIRRAELSLPLECPKGDLEEGLLSFLGDTR